MSTTEGRELSEQFTSGIRPPSQIPTSNQLFEMSAAATNARSSMPPPQASGNKRKTLAERAGEPGRSAPAPPSSRPVNTYIRATSIAGVPRETLFSSSISTSRPSSVASTRNVSNSSYSSSVGSGTRPPSSQSYRPQSAMSRLQKPHPSSGRPAVSLEVHEEEPGTTQNKGQRKGMTSFSSIPRNLPQSKKKLKHRGSCDALVKSSSHWVNRPFSAFSMREISLNTAFNSLTLDSGPAQSVPNAEMEGSPSLPRTDAAPKADVPSTPSYIPKLAPRTALSAEIPSPSRSPKKSPKKLPLYLNKASNDVVAWDTDSRLDEMETMYSHMKENWHGATSESNSLREIMAVYKIRSGSLESVYMKSVAYRL